MNAPPIPLAGEARKFWTRHAARLRAAGLLTEADLDSFAVLCLTWGKLVEISKNKTGAERFREMVQLNQLLKQYQQYAREFGLMPASRKRAKLDPNTPPAKDEFGL